MRREIMRSETYENRIMRTEILTNVTEFEQVFRCDK